MKQLTAFLGLILISLQGNAQRLQAGATGSLEIFSIKGAGIKPGYKPGYNAGLYVQWKLAKGWKVRTEALFTQKNTEAASDFKDTYPQASLSTVQPSILINAISIPLLISRSIGRNWSVLAGSQYTCIVDTDEKLLREGKSAFRKYDWNVVGGVQLQLTAALAMQGRFTYGLTDLNTISDARSWNSRSISLGFGWRIL